MELSELAVDDELEEMEAFCASWVRYITSGSGVLVSKCTAEEGLRWEKWSCVRSRESVWFNISRRVVRV